MKTKTLIYSVLFAFMAITWSCENMKTSKFDGTYDCSTTMTDYTSDLEDEPTGLQTDGFTATIDLQEISAAIDGRTSTGDVSNDGDFYLIWEWSIPLVADVTVEVDGTVDKDGSMSGTIVETATYFGGIGNEVINGTFSGSAD